jgi:hypothetical protein
MYAFTKMSLTWLHGYFKAWSVKELDINAEKVYREHYERIRKMCLEERLLDYKLGMGLAPLSRFSGEGGAG